MSSSRVRAVTRIIGISRSWGSVFSRRQTSIPLISGIEMSMSTTSGRSAAIMSNACGPLNAELTV